MRTTINLDEQLIAQAQRMTCIQEKATLIHEGLRVLIAREGGRRLARLGGSDPRAKAPRGAAFHDRFGHFRPSRA
jgi:Arc/MetJ family transcription regulator